MDNNLESFKSSVMLCAKRLSLIEQINDINSLLNENFMLDKDFVNYYAKNVIKKGNVLLRFIVCAICLVPFVLLVSKFKLIDDSGPLFAILANVYWITIFIVLSKINKVKKIKIAKRDYLPDYAKRRNTIMKSRDDLKSYKNELQDELSQLIQIMNDRSICIIHQNYWDDAIKIWSLVELGRATSMASAINLFESIKREKQRDVVLQQQLENTQRTLESQIRAERLAQEAADNSSRAEMYSLFTLANTIRN